MKKACLLLLSLALPAQAAPDNFAACLASINEVAADRGISADVRAKVIPELQWRDDVIELDRRQPEFSSSFSRYFGRAVSAERIKKGQALYAEHQELLTRLTAEYGVPGRYLIAFWGLETNYGGYLGNTPSLDALVTLACDTRRSGYFRSELLEALKLLDDRHLSVEQMRGSWAGALGLVQFMPSNYRRYGQDADGDGRVDLFGSIEDALTSAAHFLAELGWAPEQRWGREVTLPDKFDYALADGKTTRNLADWNRLGLRTAFGEPLTEMDLPAALLLPSGHAGPAFLSYPNFRVIRRWNNSSFYALAVGHLADRVVGAPALRQPPPPETERIPLRAIELAQQRLNSLGFKAGEPDGIIGPATRAAVRQFQQRKGLIADGHIDRKLLQQLDIPPL